MTHPIQQEQNPEPWIPEGMPEWKVGMHVRVRVSGECSAQCPNGCPWREHANWNDDMGYISAIGRLEGTGCTICGGSWIRNYSGSEDHNYAVTFNNGIVQYAASELIPLSDEGRER